MALRDSFLRNFHIRIHCPGIQESYNLFLKAHVGQFHHSTPMKKLNQEFQKWCNGGGMFHKSTCFDPTAQIEISDSESVVGPNVCIGAGNIVRPSAMIGHSTITGHMPCFDYPANHLTRRDTVIGDNTKIDNLVQIGHNVEIGKNRMLCGQVGIAGSVSIGDYVTLGGRASIHDHVTIASKVRLAANGCITNNITESGDYGGFPAVPINEWRKHIAVVRKISKQFQLNKNLKSPINTSMS